MEIITLLLRAIIFMSIGILIANIFIESNIMNKFQFIIKPLCIKSHLPKECVFSFFTCMLSPSAGKAILSEFYKAGKVNKKEVILTTVMNTFATTVGESLLKIHALIAIVLMGPFIGGIYVALGFLSAFIQGFSAFLIARFMLPPPLELECSYSLDEKNTISLNKSTLKIAFKKATKTIKRVLPIILLTFFIVHILTYFGFINSMGVLFEPTFMYIGLPGESVTILIAQLLHFSAGYATVSMLLMENAISPKGAIVSLLIGSMMNITLIYAKFSFPSYVSLFGKFGLKIALINYMSSMITKVAIISMILIFV